MPEIKVGFVHNDVQWVLDPLDKYLPSKTTPESLAEGLGLIPNFITEDTDNVREEAIMRYGFHMGGDMGGKVTPEGIYRYPGDPDLYPYAVALLPNKGMKVFVYAYGIISFVEADGTHVTYRFD